MFAKGKGVISAKKLRLPANYSFLAPKKAWKYTCRVCDDDVYDGCQDVILDSFFSDFQGIKT